MLNLDLDPNSQIWLLLGRISTLLSFLALGAVMTAAWQWLHSVRRRELRERRQAELAAGQTSRPVALVISGPDKPIEEDVRRYFAQARPDLSTVRLPLGADDPGGEPGRCPIVPFTHGSSDLTPGVVDADLEKLRAVDQWLKEQGFSELHLFMRSTVAFGAAVGCMFTNWGEVHVYHRNGSSYEHWFSLDEVKRVQSPPALGEAVAGVAARVLTHWRSRSMLTGRAASAAPAGE